MSGGVRNISVSNCQFLGTDVGLRFKSRRGRGGIVENIYISDIYMFNILTDSFCSIFSTEVDRLPKRWKKVTQVQMLRNFIP